MAGILAQDQPSQRKGKFVSAVTNMPRLETQLPSRGRLALAEFSFICIVDIVCSWDRSFESKCSRDARES
jgi:hypothetical protein